MLLQVARGKKSWKKGIPGWGGQVRNQTLLCDVWSRARALNKYNPTVRRKKVENFKFMGVQGYSLTEPDIKKSNLGRKKRNKAHECTRICGGGGNKEKQRGKC